MATNKIKLADCTTVQQLAHALGNFDEDCPLAEVVKIYYQCEEGEGSLSVEAVARDYHPT